MLIRRTPLGHQHLDHDMKHDHLQMAPSDPFTITILPNTTMLISSPIHVCLVFRFWNCNHATWTCLSLHGGFFCSTLYWWDSPVWLRVDVALHSPAEWCSFPAEDHHWCDRPTRGWHWAGSNLGLLWIVSTHPLRHVSWGTSGHTSVGYIPRDGTARSSGRHMFSLSRCCQAIFQSLVSMYLPTSRVRGFHRFIIHYCSSLLICGNSLRMIWALYWVFV